MKSFLTFQFGMFIGAAISVGILMLMRTTLHKPIHEVGTCLSNGLFYEEIVEIRNPGLLREKLYVMNSYIQGRLSAPNTTEAWIVDKNYVKINKANCKERR